MGVDGRVVLLQDLKKLRVVDVRWGSCGVISGRFI